MAKWDWYQTTVHGGCPEEIGLVSHLLKAYEMSDYSPAMNRNGYRFGAQIMRGDRKLLHLCWGGQPGINCTATSHESIEFAEILKKSHFNHKPTRLDACEDWYQKGLFDDMAKKLISFAKKKRLSINQQGDWVRNEARTLYIGSKTSAICMKIYEKTYEQRSKGVLGVPDDWVRLEVTIKPAGNLRDFVAKFEPDDLFGVNWMPDALAEIDYFSNLKEHSIGTVWRASDAERARAALISQYGKIMESWAIDCGGFHNLGEQIEKQIIESRQKKLVTA